MEDEVNPNELFHVISVIEIVSPSMVEMFCSCS